VGTRLFSATVLVRPFFEWSFSALPILEQTLFGADHFVPISYVIYQYISAFLYLHYTVFFQVMTQTQSVSHCLFARSP